LDDCIDDYFFIEDGSEIKYKLNSHVMGMGIGIGTRSGSGSGSGAGSGAGSGLGLAQGPEKNNYNMFR
jgi:hypothetical protein